MRAMISWVLGSVLVLGLLSAVPGGGVRGDEKGDAKKKDDGWKEMFDGKTLTGWKANEKPDNWKIEDGCIVGRGSRSHLFYTAAEFKDFEFSAEIKTEKGTNSGIYFHTKFQDSGWPEHGYEAQVNNTHSDPVKSGSLYNTVKVYKSEAKDGEWFTETIKVEGRQITITVAGKTVVDYTEPADTKGPRKLSQGLIALQQHDPGSVVRYKSLKIRPIEAKK